MSLPDVIKLPNFGTHPILGPLFPDPVANTLGTGFCRFSNGDFDGLCREAGRCIDILAIVSTRPGSGKFSTLVNALREAYPVVRFYEVMNEDLLKWFLNNGFYAFDEWGTSGPNMMWESGESGERGRRRFLEEMNRILSEQSRDEKTTGPQV